MTTATNQNRALQWLPLLRRLTEVCEGCAVFGDVEEGFSGVGDIDLVAAERSWTLIENEFRSWAASFGLEPVVVCTHRMDLLTLLAGGEGPTFFEVEVRSRRFFRGAKVWEAEDLSGLMEMDQEGFRRLRPGAIGVVRMIPNAFDWRGNPKLPQDKVRRKFRVLKDDPDGIVAAASLFGGARRFVVKAAEAAARDESDRWAILAIQVWAMIRSITHPRTLLARARTRLGRKSCDVSAILARGRGLPDNLEAWIGRVRRDHPVYWEPDRTAAPGVSS